EETYAHADSAVIAAGTNPLNERYSIVVFAGLGARATRRAIEALPRRAEAAEVLLMPAAQPTKAMRIMPTAHELRVQAIPPRARVRTVIPEVPNSHFKLAIERLMMEVIDGKSLEEKRAQVLRQKLPELEKEYDLNPETVARFRERLNGN